MKALVMRIFTLPQLLFLIKYFEYFFLFIFIDVALSYYNIANLHTFNP